MKMFKFVCPFCAQSLEVEASKRGEAVICSSCSKPVPIPRKAPHAFAYFVTTVVGLLIVAALAAGVMIMYIYTRGPKVDPSARLNAASLSPLDKLKYDAERGDTVAQSELGRITFLGDGVRCNKKEGIKWLKKAAENGDTIAQVCLGDIYYSGDGVTEDARKAAEWYKLAAAKGDAVSQNCLAILYETGEGVARDEEKALEYYAASARQGNADAKENLIRLIQKQQQAELNGYENGLFIPQMVFNQIHPIGTAKSITVDHLSFDDQNGYIIRCTLNWQGPITVNGYTRFQLTEKDGVSSFNILDTNGMTNDGATDLAVLGGFLLVNSIFGGE